MGNARTVSKTKMQVHSRVVELTYLQTQQVMGGARDMGQIAGAGGGVAPVSSGKTNPGSPGFLGIGAEAASSSSNSATDTGWTITRTWQETHFDKAAYRIGLRDVSAFNYRFAPVSELVTIRWTSPKPISKVLLRTVEKIPSSYPLDRAWIVYYVSHDDKTWHRITPQDRPAVVGADGQVVPSIVTYNPGLGGDAPDLRKFIETDRPVDGVRLRIVIYGAQDVNQPDRHTPELVRYRIYLYPQDGL